MRGIWRPERRETSVSIESHRAPPEKGSCWPAGDVMDLHVVGPLIIAWGSLSVKTADLATLLVVHLHLYFCTWVRAFGATDSA